MRKLTKREKVLMICLEQTQMLLAQCVNDPTSPTVHKAPSIQFDLNKRVMHNIKEGS